MVLQRVLIGAVIIFLVRVFSVTLSTLRYLMMGRTSKMLVAVIAFIEALTFALTFGMVAADLTNIWYLTAYSGGFAAGTWVGTLIEEWLGRGYHSVNIVSMGNSLSITKAVREAGFGATRTAGEGSSGSVGLIYVVARRKEVPRVVEIAAQIDPKAFITVEEARTVVRGHISYGRS
nr:DUF2179 domain-containing protein [Anaerolineae bacterium]